LAQLEGLVDALSYAEIYMPTMTMPANHLSNQYYYKINTTEITLSGNSWDYSKICLFYKLDKITFNSCNDLSSFSHNKISNKTVKEIIFNSLTGSNAITGLDGFPQLEKFTLISCPSIKDVVAVLNSYTHKIKHINIKTCAQINNTELMTYCQKNNIKLDLA
jgi:hypothetical protein